MKEDRILSSAHGQYIAREWGGRNESGIEPLCDKVLVLVDPGSTRTQSGLLVVPDDIVARQTLASTTGIVVAAGPLAFTYSSDRALLWEGQRPAPGARVCFARYAGQEYAGSDGELYRLMDDRSVAGIFVDTDSVPSEMTSAQESA